MRMKQLRKKCNLCPVIAYLTTLAVLIVKEKVFLQLLIWSFFITLTSQITQREQDQTVEKKSHWLWRAPGNTWIVILLFFQLPWPPQLPLPLPKMIHMLYIRLMERNRQKVIHWWGRNETYNWVFATAISNDHNLSHYQDYTCILRYNYYKFGGLDRRGNHWNMTEYQLLPQVSTQNYHPSF